LSLKLQGCRIILTQQDVGYIINLILIFTLNILLKKINTQKLYLIILLIFSLLLFNSSKLLLSGIGGTKQIIIENGKIKMTPYKVK